MGDEVKITVIATGFKQQGEPGARRERMLAESTLPTARYDVPIAPRIMTPRAPYTETTPVVPIVTAPVQATHAVVHAEEAHQETHREPAPEVIEHKLSEPTPPPSIIHRQELVPVPRSVFDDDFFRASIRRDEEPRAEPPDTRMPSARGFDSPEPRPLRVQFQESPRTHEEPAEYGVSEPVVRFSGTAPVEPAESDELDIPAFLRRGQ